MKKLTIHSHCFAENESNETVEGATYMDIYRQLCRRLSVEGPRGLTASEGQANGYPVGAAVRASLYSGESYIRSRDGRILYRS